MRRAVRLLSAALCLLALPLATPAGANVGLELTGVLSGLPAGVSRCRSPRRRPR